MPKYDSVLCGVDELSDILRQCNEKNVEIENVFYVTDTNQVCIIYSESEVKKNRFLDMIKKSKEEEY